MINRFRQILTEECQLDPNLPIVAGVSGGPDSLCLLSLLKETGWRPIAAHFNHMLRPEAEEEAAAVEALAARMGLPFVGGRADVREHAQSEKLSIETAARDLRYAFLFAQARQHEAQAVAVGHTADDQVETVLMHFIRGAGLNGLKGMPVRGMLESYDRDIPVVRPLLEFWRSDTVAYCAEHGLQPHYDASNDSIDFLRNRVRNELIPAVESYNPRFREAVWRASKTLAADHELLQEALAPLWRKAVVARGHEYVALHLPFLLAQGRGLQMHMVRRAVQSLIPEHDTGYAELERAVTFLLDAGQERTDFGGGVLLLREDELLYVTTAEARLPAGQWPQMPAGTDTLTMTVPAKVSLADGWQIMSAVCRSAELPSPRPWEEADRFRVYLDAKDLPERLVLRIRNPGDRLEPLGMSGHSRKLSDVFVDSKLPARARTRWPLVCAGNEIIWVPGYAPAEAHRLRPESTRVLCLTVEPPG